MKELLRVPFALLFAASGVNHFSHTAWFMRLMPPYLPWHRELVLLSGAAELLLAVLLLSPRHSRLAAWGLVALLVAVFPANVHMAMTSGTPAAAMPEVSPLLSWLRLPLQSVLLAWALWYTR